MLYIYLDSIGNGQWVSGGQSLWRRHAIGLRRPKPMATARNGSPAAKPMATARNWSPAAKAYGDGTQWVSGGQSLWRRHAIGKSWFLC